MLGEIISELERKAENLKNALNKHDEYYFSEAKIAPTTQDLYTDVNFSVNVQENNNNSRDMNTNLGVGLGEEVKQEEVVTKIPVKTKIITKSEAGTKKGVTKGEVAFEDDEADSSFLVKQQNSQEVIVTTKREEIRTEIQTEDGKGQKPGLFCGFCYR